MDEQLQIEDQSPSVELRITKKPDMKKVKTKFQRFLLTLAKPVLACLFLGSWLLYSMEEKRNSSTKSHVPSS